MNVSKELFKHKSDKFRKFEANLVPTIDIKNIIGTKSNYQKQIAKKLYLTKEYKKYILKCPHKYLEENLVHAHLIGLIKDYDESIFAIKKLFPYIDNWMVSDTLNFKPIKNNEDRFIKFIYSCLKSKKPYVIRVGIIFLKKYYLDEYYDIKQMNKVFSIKHDDYYVKMMQAWYMADGLIKHPKEFISVLKKKKLDPFVQNKGIQKARESYRISNSLKKDLLKYKI